MNNPFEQCEFEFVKQGRKWSIYFGQDLKSPCNEKDLTNWPDDMNHFPLDTKDSFFVPTSNDYRQLSRLMEYG